MSIKTINSIGLGTQSYNVTLAVNWCMNYLHCDIHYFNGMKIFLDKQGPREGSIIRSAFQGIIKDIH